MKNLAGRPFALLGVHSLGLSPEKLKSVMEKEKLDWRTFADGEAISAKWSARSTPTYYIIDHEGLVVGEVVVTTGVLAMRNGEGRIKRPSFNL